MSTDRESYADQAVTRAGCQNKPVTPCNTRGTNTQRIGTIVPAMLQSYRSTGNRTKPKDTPRYLWAKHPAITGNSVPHVQAVSSRAILSHRGASQGPVVLHGLLQHPKTQRAPPG